MSDKKFIIKIDGQAVEANAGENLLAVALRHGFEVPHLCDHPDAAVRANCRMCLVKIKGVAAPQTACSTEAAEGMEIQTDAPELRRARKFNLEMIFGEHVEDCDDCVLRGRCALLDYRKKYNSKMLRFPDRKVNRPIYDFGPIIFDQTKCIDCRLCVEVCPTKYLEVHGRGSDLGIRPTADKKRDCIYCGQCVVHCPVGAIKSAGEFDEDEAKLAAVLKNKNLTVVVQFAPAVRSSIGEELGLPHGAVLTGQMAAGLRRLGFRHVFDTAVGADFTTNEEAGEAVERVREGKGLPIFTSCCPAWTRFLEYHHPEFIKNITSVRSPQLCLGGIIKGYWAQKNKIDPKKIFSVSVMPCAAKKYEIIRKECEFRGMKPVDLVLTTRQLARLFINNKIDLAKLKPEPADDPFGQPSGAGVIYGASGGVMESALRTAYFRVTGRNLKNLEFKQVRGQQGIKRAAIKLDGRATIKAAVVNGIKNAEIILKELKKNPRAYDFVEVMACPGGCVGGGGQPIPTLPFNRAKRAESLYQIDAGKKIRLAHENPFVKKAYAEFFTNEKVRRETFHTSFSPKPRNKVSTRHRAVK